MTNEQIRLEIIKLLYRGDRTPANIIVDAKVYEDYILKKEDVEAPKKGAAKSSGKAAGNLKDLLS